VHTTGPDVGGPEDTQHSLDAQLHLKSTMASRKRGLVGRSNRRHDQELPTTVSADPCPDARIPNEAAVAAAGKPQGCKLERQNRDSHRGQREIITKGEPSKGGF